MAYTCVSYVYVYKCACVYYIYIHMHVYIYIYMHHIYIYICNKREVPMHICISPTGGSLSLLFFSKIYMRFKPCGVSAMECSLG